MSFSIQEIIERSLIWLKTDEGFQARVLFNQGDARPVQVSYAELREVNPHLPEIILGMLDYRTRQQTQPATTVMASWIKSTLDMHAGRHQVIPSTSGDFPVEKILNMVDGDRSNCKVIKVAYYRTRTIAVNGGTARIQFVVDRDTMGLYVWKDWLDGKYPGWEERYTNASLLGLEGEELVGIVFRESPPVTSAPLPDITFA